MIAYRCIFLCTTVKSAVQRSTKPLIAMDFVRNIASIEVTKNITLLSDKKKHGKVINFKLQNEENRPLVIMLPWLLAKEKHVLKFANFYIKWGFDVLNVNISPWQLLWPLRGTQLVALDVVKFLDRNKAYSPLLIHGFSVGGYLWSEALVHIVSNKSQYEHIVDRIVGQVWDSAADITEIPTGFPMAVFPRNQVLQSALRRYVMYHMKTFDKVATCHYVRGSQMFHTNIVKSPALFLVSKVDPIGSEKSNLRVKESWENNGIKVSWKCWDNTPHVGHFHRQPEEYLEELSKFLDNIGFKLNEQDYQESSQLKAKL